MKTTKFRLCLAFSLFFAGSPAAWSQGYCGDGYCSPLTGEPSWCAEDCGFGGWCGDGLCQPQFAEDFNNCSIDCPPPPPPDIRCATTGSASVPLADIEMQEMRAEPLIPTPRLIYLNGGGGRFTTGNDDNSSLNIASQIPSGAPKDAQGRTRFEAFHRPADWAQLVQCVKNKFSRWDVLWADDLDSAKPNDPGTQPHIEAVITGTTAQSVGWSAGTGGVARPLSCGSDGGPVVNERGVAFIFARGYDSSFFGSFEFLCTAVAHEIGHNLTLDHSKFCSDIMFPGSCSTSASFLNTTGLCRTSDNSADKDCACTGTQNSFQRLDSVLGVKTSQPSTTITSPADRAQVSRSQPFNVRATITSSGATVTRAKLRWSTVSLPDEELVNLGSNVWGKNNVSLASVPDGEHRIRIIAYDNLGRKKKSKKRTFTVISGVSCIPSCSGAICGTSDGCGGTCNPGSGCVSGCTPSCSGVTCGSPNGCGGTCNPGSGCVSCTPNCSGVVCGLSNGCGGICNPGSGCVSGCTPQCSGHLCGNGNGCGGVCGSGSGCAIGCNPACSGVFCGEMDPVCGDVCQLGSGCIG